MHYQGDYNPGDIVYFKFYQWNSSGSQPAPATITSPAISVYKDDNTTESTSGVTLTAAFDSRTGLYQVKIDTNSDSSFYAAGHDFDVVITAGTVGGSVVSTIVGSFSLQHRSPLRPTTAGNTLDVSATGEAGLDFSNIKDASSGHTLSNITIPTVTTVTNDATGVTTLLSRIGSAITISGGRVEANATYWNGHAVAAENVNGVPKVDVVDWLGSGPAAFPSNFSALDIDSLRGVNVRKIYGNSTQALNLSTFTQNYAAGNLLASVQTVSGAVTVGTNNDKTGYKLASDGLDSISTAAPTGVAANFREMMVQLWRRFFKKSTLTTTQLKTYADDGAAVVTTQSVSDDGTTQTQNAAT